jgi:protoporphyrin/coproporphyrin ferrochelatase
MSKRAILLLAHGTPGSLDDVPAYLRNITGGRPLPESVIAEVTHRYAQIGHSPLTDITHAQARGLATATGVPTYVGMRNWHPFIADTIQQMVADGVTDAVAICLAPQNSQTSVGLYKRATLTSDSHSLHIDFVDSWHDHPLLARAFATQLQLACQRAGACGNVRVPVLFTAHSVPCRTIQAGDPYGIQCRETAAAVARLTGLRDFDWFFAFQSQGMSAVPGSPNSWLGPTVEDTIAGLHAAGHRSIIIQPIGFVCDHVEVLYDIDIAFHRVAEKSGMVLTRAASLNASPEFIATLAAVATSRFAARPQEASR